MPETAHMVVERAQLVKDIVRRAGEGETGIDRVRHRHPSRIDAAAVAALDATGTEPTRAHSYGLRALRYRCVAWRVHKLRCDDARGAAVVEDLVGAAPALLSGVPNPDQRHVRKTVEGRLASDLGGAAAIGVIDRRRAEIAGVERADHIALLGRRHRAFGAADRHPDWRVRLLVGSRPDIYLPVMKMRALPIEWAVERRHRLQDQVVRLPEALHHVGRAAVRRRDFERHTLDKAHL